MKENEKPKIVVLGLSHELYDRTYPDYIGKQKEQLDLFTSGLEESTDIISRKVCIHAGQLEQEILNATINSACALLIVPMCYTPSLMSAPSLLKSDIPLVIWNTQELIEITKDFSFNDLLMNHVIQGTQDLTNVLIRANKIFGMESGHYRDSAAINRLREWLVAANTAQYARKIRVGLMGNPGQDMGDFGVDETLMRTKWGPVTIYLSPGRLIEILMGINEKQIEMVLHHDREFFDVDEKLSEETHRISIKLELAIREIIKENRLNAFTMNFTDIVNDGRFPAIPFLGINKMISEGLGYAGEGNTTIAALMTQMANLCGGANFTETFTVDFKKNLILMSHMQECNFAYARKDRKIRLINKDFWAKGIGPYAGMYFSLEPGPVTLVNITTDTDGDFYYICYETFINDLPPLDNYDIPHWFIKPDEDAGEFLTRLSMAGGTHHLVSVPGHCAGLIAKLAVLQNFDCKIL